MHITTATVLALFIGVIIPHLSSLVSNTKYVPAWAGGYVTLFLSAVTGFLTEWARTPNNYSWVHGAETAGVAFLFAAMSRTVVTKETPWDNNLIDLGASRANRRGGKPLPGPSGEEIIPADAA